MNMEINPSEYKVLIVDDVISNVLLLKVLLTNEKFKIVTAGNGTQALEQVKKENPDLVLLDVMMPDISGFEVAQQMKADPEMAEIPIIFRLCKMILFAATNEIWCVTRIINSSLLNGFEIKSLPPT